MAVSATAAQEIADGDYRGAFARLRESGSRPFLQAGFPDLPDLVEAAVRSGSVASARELMPRLDAYADAAGTPWVVGLTERCHALLADDTAAEQHYRRSIECLDSSGHQGDCARSRLLYGKWLRRMRRRSDARIQLQAAWATFGDVGADAFAARARRALKAAGAEPDATSSPLGSLTPQEIEVARLAAGGATNAEIGSTLFISANTVDYHLRKVFRKLGVTSRRQLTEHVPTL